MVEARPADLSYGHLGEPFYDVNDKEWKFARRPGIGPRLAIIGELRLALHSSLSQNASVRQQSARARNRHITELTRLYPELVPAASLVAPLARVSEVITEVTASHDPQVSDLIAFGTANRLVRNRPSVRTIPIAVVAGGVAGEGIRFLQLRRQTLRWPEHKNVGLSLSTLEGAKEAWWSGNGSPIQQICFSSIDEVSGGWLAARYHGETTVFRPLYHQLPVALARPIQGCHPNAVYQPSCIDPNPIVTLDIQATGGAPHVGVSFNPWYERQLAIIDVQGHWSIWDIEGQYGRTWTAKSSHEGHLSEDLAEGEESSGSLSPDGWGMVLFVSNVNTLLVVGRRMLAVINNGSKTRRLKGPDLGLTKNADWILDINKSSANSNQVFVVTSARVFWIEVHSHSDTGNSDRNESGAVILLSWLHFRNQDDISLRMQVIGHNETTLVTTYSRLNNLCTVFTFEKDDSTSMPISVSDPYHLPLDLAADSQSGSVKDEDHARPRPNVTALTLTALNYDVPPGSRPSGPGKLYLDDDVRFYKLSILYNDLSVRESIYIRASSKDLYNISMPTVKSFASSVKGRPKYVGDDFVVPDNLVSDDLKDVNIRQRSTRRLHGFRGRRKATEGLSDPWTLDFSWLHRSLRKDSTSAAASGSKLKHAPPETSLEDALNRLALKIRDSLNSEKHSTMTILESLDITSFREDIDIASASIKDWLGNNNNAPPSLKDTDDDDGRSRRPAPLMTNGLSETLFGYHALEDNQPLSDIYEKLIESWISPLSPDVPNRVRVQMEKAIRNIATQLFLANLVLRPFPYAVPEEPEETIDDSLPDFSNKLSLPMRARQMASRSSSRGRLENLSSSPQLSSQLSENAGFTIPDYPFHPTFVSHDPTPPLSSQTSSPSITEPFDPASLRLGALSTLIPQQPLPTSLANVLSHWTVGADPVIYDWSATQAALCGLSETEDAESDITVKRKIRRVKRKKRLRGDTAGSTSQPVPESVDSQGETAGSSQLMKGFGLPSQVGLEVGSQVSVVRKEGRRKKVKRAAGF